MLYFFLDWILCQIYLMGLVNNPETSQGLKLWQGLDPSWEKMLR